MTTMRAVVIREPGGVEVLELREVPAPEPGPGELLIKVAATALNRADLLQRRGQYPAPPDAPQEIPGLEYSGVVEAKGRGCALFEVGDRVMGIVGGGAYAEYLTVHERCALKVPRRLELAEAAALPEAFLTAFDALFLQGDLRVGERVLIHAVGSGVGTAAIQLVRRAGALSLGTARSEEKLQRAQRLGLDVPILVEGSKFADRVKAATGKAGADLVLDLVGGGYLEENLKALALRGRQVLVGLTAGATAQLPMGLLLNKRITLKGTVLRSRPLEEKIAVTRAFAHYAGEALESGALIPVIDQVLPIASVREAHSLMERNANFGKLVLTW